MKQRGRIRRLDVHLDAQWSDLALEDHSRLIAHGITASHVKRHGEAVRDRRLAQQLPGQGRIVGRHGDVGIVVDGAPGHERVGRRAVAVEDRFDEGRTVDGVGNGLAHLHVAKWSDLVVGDQVVRLRRTVDHDLDRRVVLDLGDQVVGQHVIHVELTRLHLEQARVVVRDQIVLHVLHRELGGHPIVGVLLEAQVLAALPAIEHVGAGADGMCRHVARTDLLEVGLRVDAAVEERDVREERRPGMLERHAHRCGVGRLHLLNRGQRP